MAAYLIVDVDDLLEHFRRRGVSIDVQELAVGLRGGAALAAGLASADRLKAVAAADWSAAAQHRTRGVDAQVVFKTAGYDIFNVTHRPSLADALSVHYFSFDPEPVDELILATTNPDLIPLVRKIKMTRGARVRMWGVEDVLKGTGFEGKVIFQPLDTLLGIQQTKNVAVYIDFENIAISLNEQGYTVNLDELVEGFSRQAKAHGQVVKMAAYAPWGQRGTLPPLVDSAGREVADDAPPKLLRANIEPVFNLPGKNSADMRIAGDIIRDSGHNDGADIYVIASGDRDFKDAINTLRTRNKTVILWTVRGTTSKQLANTPNLIIEHVEDFTRLQTHQSFGSAARAAAVVEEAEVISFTPSQWSSVIVQADVLSAQTGKETLTRTGLINQLLEVGAVVSKARGDDLVAQALSIGILKTTSGNRIMLDKLNPVVEKTRLIRDRIVLRVTNTLTVRGWEYVNYGFLLKGLAMDRELDRPGLNYSDQWRSDWIDCLVRERVLLRELVPHRHNPDDLVPVIKLRPDYQLNLPDGSTSAPAAEPDEETWSGISLNELEQMEPDTVDMVCRVVVSVEQFTSFRGFDWCPLGSLHKRLRQFDKGMAFQRAVEYLIENNAALVKEYPNPQSEFFTKGISLDAKNEIVRTILLNRDIFVRALLTLYERNVVISEQSIATLNTGLDREMMLWFSVMQTENVLNDIPGRPGQYSLFRTHHTVTLVAEAMRRSTNGARSEPPRDQ
jgi:hypothetical protein